MIDAGSAGGGPFLSFRTPDHGFATFSTNGLDGLSVYETTDGGMTWTGPLELVVPLPSKFQGHAGGILSISNGKADNVPFDNRLLLSLDGGATWKERTFPIGAEAPKRELKWVTAVWDDGGGRIVLAIDLGDGDQLYVSDDDGGTWRFVRGWRSFPSGHLTVGFQVALLSATEWVVMATDGSRTWSTVDGGGEWRETAGTTKVVLDEISIASADHALAVHRCLTDQQAALGPDPVCDGARARSVLLVTSDGGGTWAPTGE